MTTTGKTAPTWVLDAAESLMVEIHDSLAAAMREQGESPENAPLWYLRRDEILSLLGSGEVLAVRHGSDKGQSARFADFYTATYDNTGSTARALIVETDEPMEIRPVSPTRVIVKRA